MAKNDPHNKAQRAYHERKKEQGLKRLSVYVPEKGKEEFQRAMKRLQNSWRKKGFID